MAPTGSEVLRPAEGFFTHKGVRYGVLRWEPLDTACAAAPPLVLLHGFAQSARTWAALAPELAAKQPVVALDLVGHGRSERPESPYPYTLEAQAEALLALLRSLGAAERAVPVIGYSMGGRVALAAAVRDSEPFAALVLESAGLGPASEEARAQVAERDRALAERLRSGSIQDFVAYWEALPLFATQQSLPAQVQEHIRAERLANSTHALAATVEGAGQHTMPGRSEVLATLAALAAQGATVRYLAGELDAAYAALAGELDAFARQHAPGIATVVVPMAGHNAHLENPQAFLACGGSSDTLTAG